jgi:hypothetical protein
MSSPMLLVSSTLTRQAENPFVMVLIDGNGMIVSTGAV